jgi:hypothetical protein
MVKAFKMTNLLEVYGKKFCLSLASRYIGQTRAALERDDQVLVKSRELHLIRWRYFTACCAGVEETSYIRSYFDFILAVAYWILAEILFSGDAEGLMDIFNINKV